MVTIHQGSNIDVMRERIPTGSVHTCVTSPPYWGLRDYGIPPSVWGGRVDCVHEWGAGLRHVGGAGLQGESSARKGRANVQSQEKVRNAGQFGAHCNAWLGCHGLEPTPELFVQHEVLIFREVWRVLRDDGTIWVNLGDSYAGSGRGAPGPTTMRNPGDRSQVPPAEGKRGVGYGTASVNAGAIGKAWVPPPDGLKNKDLVGIPWRVALALQADGWYLRSDIIWHKPNPMPESVTDRPTKAHEYIFLLSKSERYHYDADAIKEKASEDSHRRYARGRGTSHKHADGGPGQQTIARSFEAMAKKRSAGVNPKAQPHDQAGPRSKQNDSFSAAVKDLVEYRNKRDVWTVNSSAYSGAHFATFPPALIRPCILAGCPRGGTVLDIFGGSGTTGEVAEQEGRNSILIELNPQYVGLAERRTAQAGLLHSA